MEFLDYRIYGLRGNPIELKEINLTDVKNDYIKLGQSINAQLKKVDLEIEDLFLTYRLGDQLWIIQALYPLKDNRMIVLYNKENEFNTPLHISDVVPFYPENFELKIEETC